MKKHSRRPAHIHLPHSATGFVTKKHLGQNFLTDPNVKRKIVTACALKPTDTVLEIGPGAGVLTREIAPLVRRLFAVEKDDKLHTELSREFTGSNVTVIHADFLEFRLEELPDDLMIIGNLPYYISTPIIEKVLAHSKKYSVFFATLQYELGQRLIAKPGTKQYGSFTCFVEFYADAKILFRIKNTAFRPVPRVHSCFFKFLPHEKFQLASDQKQRLFTAIQQAFQSRRKTLPNALAGLGEQDKFLAILKELNIDPRARPENLTLDDYRQIILRMGEENQGFPGTP